MQPLLSTCNDSELNQLTADPGGGKNKAELNSCRGPQNDAFVGINSEPLLPSLPLPREQISTPVSLSELAKIIVQEVLSKGILSHGFTHLTFDDAFSEHEVDLKI
jgi:hypothetical protein